MSDIPNFTLYGEGDDAKEQSIQPELALREWGDLNKAEKAIALKQLMNKGWLRGSQEEILQTITYLNHKFLRTCPGKHLHQATGDMAALENAAMKDFSEISLSIRIESPRNGTGRKEAGHIGARCIRESGAPKSKSEPSH
jgi:thermostable 8-oxoguanine DNA glycosylase